MQDSKKQAELRLEVRRMRKQFSEWSESSETQRKFAFVQRASDPAAPAASGGMSVKAASAAVSQLRTKVLVCALADSVMCLFAFFCVVFCQCSACVWFSITSANSDRLVC